MSAQLLSTLQANRVWLLTPRANSSKHWRTMNKPKRIYPFSEEAYRDNEYNEVNGYERSDYEQHAPFDVDDYDDWLEYEGIPDER